MSMALAGAGDDSAASTRPMAKRPSDSRVLITQSALAIARTKSHVAASIARRDRGWKIALQSEERMAAQVTRVVAQ